MQRGFTRSREDVLIDSVVYFLIGLLCFSMLYPFWNSVVLSLNDGADAMRGGITIWPRQFSLENYQRVLQDTRLLRSFAITVFRTAAGTFISILLTSLLAYGLTKPTLLGRKYYMALAVFTLYFSGGLIPFFLIIRGLGLINTPLVFLFVIDASPAVVNVFFMIIFRFFFLAIPGSIEDSAQMDGAGNYTRFFRIVMPLSMPVFATLILFTAVGHWNAWFDGAIFVNDPHLVPLQTLLREIIISNSLAASVSELKGNAAEQVMMSHVTTRSLSMATMVYATVPILLVYPLLQRYFVHGIMVGSLKE